MSFRGRILGSSLNQEDSSRNPSMLVSDDQNLGDAAILAVHRCVDGGNSYSCLLDVSFESNGSSDSRH